MRRVRSEPLDERREVGKDHVADGALREQAAQRDQLRTLVEETKPPVEYGEWGRVELTTLTREFFMPRFLERDEGEREPPFEKYPWDGVSGVRPFHEIAKTTTVGVY